MPRQKSKSLTWLDIADVFVSSSRLLNQFSKWLGDMGGTSHAAIRNRQTLALNDQRLTNLQLDAKMKHERRNKLSNEVVMTDARAELEYKERTVALELKQLQALALRKKLEAAGAFKSNFEAFDYPEPGDVRRGIPYQS